MTLSVRPQISETFGDWTVIEGSILRGVGKKAKSYSRCQCRCGNERIVANGNLRSGKSAGCGCSKIEETAKRTKTHGAASAREHGSKAASVWLDMHKRCSNPNHANYVRYGARGIMVCERWSGDDGFANFLTDMGEPKTGYSIGRKDNDGHYSPDNCCWETRQEQQSNMRSNVYGYLHGERLTMEEIARREKVSPPTIKRRLNKGLYQL